MKRELNYPRWLIPLVGLALLVSTTITPGSANALSVKPAPNLGRHGLSSANLKVKTIALRFGPVNLKKLDPTDTSKMKYSRAARESVPVKTWANSWTAVQIAYNESRNNCKTVSRSGKYRGKWQMDSHFWKTYGGLKYAPRPELATCEQQDIVAHNGWISRHYQPWQTYSLVS